MNDLVASSTPWAIKQKLMTEIGSNVSSPFVNIVGDWKVRICGKNFELELREYYSEKRN